VAFTRPIGGTGHQCHFSTIINKLVDNFGINHGRLFENSVF
jgi:hypothetical protein